MRRPGTSTIGTLSAVSVAVGLLLNVGDERPSVAFGVVVALALAAAFWTDRVGPRLTGIGSLSGTAFLLLAVDVRFPHRAAPMACDAGQCATPAMDEVTAVAVAAGALGVLAATVSAT